MLPGAALGSLAARFCWRAALQALDGTRARFGAPPFMLPGAALGSLAARFCWQGQHFRLWTVPERVSAPPFLDAAPLAALGSLAAGFCWQGQWEPRGSFLLAGAALGQCPSAFRGPPPSRLVSAGRRSTSGSGRYPSAFRGPPGAALGSLAAGFCWQGQHFRLWTVPERVSGPPPPLMLPGAALGLAPPPP